MDGGPVGSAHRGADSCPGLSPVLIHGFSCLLPCSLDHPTLGTWKGCYLSLAPGVLR